ncbi:hypothetical protein WJX75_001203 [Coccomyxa subellipsoidea]|uniref:Bacterial Ig-like domain-containing protein n=1 Tax=Coccomyxa subellipsoidea TaxID=248742 RepID=A0ABR2YDJ8_9CHLO
MVQGNAFIVKTFSQAGPYTITAQFLGSPDGVYLSSTSGPVTLQVTPSPVSSTPTATSAPPTTTAAPPTTMVMSSTTTPGSATTPDSVPVLKVFADPPAAQFPGCGKPTNLTATVSDATISGSITFDLAGPRLKDVLSATLMTSLFPAFPPGEYSIRTTYTGPSTLNGGSTQVTYPVSKLCF